MARRGESRQKALYKLVRGSARYAFLRARNDPEGTNATFEVTCAWASLRESRRNHTAIRLSGNHS